MSPYLNPKKYLAYAVRSFMNCLSPLIKHWEKRYINKYGEQLLRHNPIFIIGAPRTGSTILYQCITNSLDVLYIDNLAAKFYKNLFFGFWLSNKIFKQKPHNCFKSSLGDTSKSGLRAPSECGSFWYRWLPRNKHHVDLEDITDQMVTDIRKELSAIINYYNKPIVINNNNIALRIRLISRAFPDAKYIICDRSPFFVSQSLLNARQKVYSSYNAWWSIMPPNYFDLLNKPAYEQVVLQQYYINKRMFSDIEKCVPKEKFCIVDYSDFCNKNKFIMEKLKALINTKVLRFGIEKYLPKESKKINLDSEIVCKLNETISNVYGKNNKG